MKTFITSDLHFGHDRSRIYCPDTRGMFASAAEMNEAMIEMWNASVSDDDIVYILGDVSFMPIEDTVEILRKLNGTKILIKGNHDRKYVKNKDFIDCFKGIYSDYMTTFQGTYIHMYHFPLCEWDRSGHGSVHLHGHLHGKESGLEVYRVRDVGFDSTGKVVSLLENIVEDALTGSIKPHH